MQVSVYSLCCPSLERKKEWRGPFRIFQSQSEDLRQPGRISAQELSGFANPETERRLATIMSQCLKIVLGHS